MIFHVLLRPLILKIIGDSIMSYGFNPQINLKTYVTSPDLYLNSAMDDARHKFHSQSENSVVTHNFPYHCPFVFVFRQNAHTIFKKSYNPRLQSCLMSFIHVQLG